MRFPTAMRTTIGLVLVAGALLLFVTTRRERADLPAWLPRLAPAIGLLGLSTLAAARESVPWSLVSIACSLVAIVLILSVLREIVKRRG